MAKTKKSYVNLVGGSSTAKSSGRKRKRLSKATSRRKTGVGKTKGRTKGRSSR